MMSAIDQRLGSPYVYGSEGPSTFDCSGFVWSVYNQLGVNFERGSARSLWSRMAPVNPEEQFKFGTLVFFSGLTLAQQGCGLLALQQILVGSH
jgi:peptidoglycan endopeptidase LytE